MINVCIAGATGWAGSALVAALLDADDVTVRSAVSRSFAGTDLGSALGGKATGIPVYATVAEALDGVDVLDRVHLARGTVKANTLSAIERDVAVVIGASGPTAEDYAEIDAAARARGVGVISSGNFSITAAMAQAAAVLGGPPPPAGAEIIDYASDTKADVPSGTSRELAERLGAGTDAGVVTRVTRRDRWSARGARRGRGGHPGPLGASAQLLGLDRGHLRAPRRAPHDPPRRRFVGRAIRRGHAARNPTRDRARRASLAGSIRCYSSPDPRA